MPIKLYFFFIEDPIENALQIHNLERKHPTVSREGWRRHGVRYWIFKLALPTQREVEAQICEAARLWQALSAHRDVGEAVKGSAAAAPVLLKRGCNHDGWVEDAGPYGGAGDAPQACRTCSY